jgi:hypothetical protein
VARNQSAPISIGGQVRSGGRGRSPQDLDDFLDEFDDEGIDGSGD